MAQDINEICPKKSINCLKMQLSSKEQIYLIILIPVLINCSLYVLQFASDFVVAFQHFKENNLLWAWITVGFMYAPAFVYFILTISRPDWWMTDDDKLYYGMFKWTLIQVIKLVAFPCLALLRHAKLIVLSIDALYTFGDKRKKTLDYVAAPAAIELYFFLQAWFQAVPQAIFQTHLLFKDRLFIKTSQSVYVHAFCVLISVCVIAIKTTSFQRYESQRVSGRKAPWAMWLNKYKLQALQNFEEKKLLRSPVIASRKEIVEHQKEIQENKNSSFDTLQRQDSKTPPLPPKNLKILPPPEPLRGITSITPLPVPDIPAPPRPDSIVNDTFVKHQESSTENLSNDNQTESNFKRVGSIKIPKRKNCVKGLDEDDPFGLLLSFLWWFLFIMARVLSVAIFIKFSPLCATGVIGFHYVVMLTYLFYNSKYYDVTSFFLNLWLGLVYIFSLIEYRVKFKKADKLIVFYYIFVTLQNTIMTIFCYLYSNFNGFWYLYSLNLIIICTTLCFLSMMVYHFLFKPEKRRVYVAQI